jgi:hypothetical protein
VSPEGGGVFEGGVFWCSPEGGVFLQGGVFYFANHFGTDFEALVLELLVTRALY